MLNNHPHLAVAYDTLFIPAVVRQDSNKNPEVSAQLLEKIRDFKRFSRFDLPDDVLDRLAPGAEDYVSLIHLIYEDFARINGKPLAGEKSPGYVRHMPMLQKLFPTAKFIHLVRDGPRCSAFIDQLGATEEYAERSGQEVCALVRESGCRQCIILGLQGWQGAPRCP